MIMKERIFCSLLLVIILSGFVMAGSEISTNFVIGESEVAVGNYVPVGGFWNDYSSYIVGALVILVIFYVALKTKNRKASKKRQVSKRKIRKKK